MLNSPLNYYVIKAHQEEYARVAARGRRVAVSRQRRLRPRPPLAVARPGLRSRLVYRPRPAS